MNMDSDSEKDSFEAEGSLREGAPTVVGNGASW